MYVMAIVMLLFELPYPYAMIPVLLFYTDDYGTVHEVAGQERQKWEDSSS